jgi:transcriptional regulator with XRE-family HTH domain
MKNLAKLRKERGLSQTAFAAALRTSQANVSQWENGHIQPRPNTITRIAKALKVREIELVL